MAAVVQVCDASKSFGSKQALNKVSLSVNEGEIFGFLGPNGAGKTTTIRCLMDFIRTDSGSVKIFGQNVKDNQSIRKDIGFLSADNQLIDRWNAIQHINFYQTVKRDKANAVELMNRLDIDPNAKAGHLSTGNKQKLGLVLALMGSPKLLILDEPTRGLDPLLQNEIYIILKDFSNKGGTVFFSSHNLSEVEHLCSTVAIIRQGSLVADKAMADLRQMKTHIISVTFTKDDVSLPKFKDIEVNKNSARSYELRVRGDINLVLKDITRHELADLEINHATLEEIFMEYYR